MRKIIGILAHVDAGKTTLSERLLFEAKALRTLGRVDEATSHLDTAPLEIRRGITIFSGQAPFAWAGQEFTLLDTPGHVDFAAEMERTLSVLDGAVLVVSGVDGVQGHTEVIWQLLEAYHVPTFLFISKMDRPEADLARCVGEIRQLFSSAAIPYDASSEAFWEEIALLDEGLMEAYLAGEEGLEKQVAALVGQRRFFPILSGSALTGEGVPALLNALADLLPTDYESKEAEPFAARVFQLRHDQRGGRLTFCKVLAGSLAVKAEVNGQKVDELRLYDGARYTQVQQVVAGQLCAMTGVEGLLPGDGLGAAPSAPQKQLAPVLEAAALYGEQDPQRVLLAFRTLEAEDPALQVEWSEESRALQVHVMGKVQLEILAELLRERFGLQVTFGQPAICYRETLMEPVTGIGHFEPLRHYAEVWLRLEPGPRGSGIQFDSACPTDVLEQSFQNLVRTHVLEKAHKGVLTGSPLADVKVVLLTGRAHLKHTEGGDFRQATYRAIRQGLASGESMLLEPWFDFTITVPREHIGRVMADVQARFGTFTAPEERGGRLLVCGSGPASAFLEYGAELAAATGGRGSFSPRFAGYAPCHDAEEVISTLGYDFERDVNDPADSVFCAHGAGYTVKWCDVPAAAHCGR